MSIPRGMSLSCTCRRQLAEPTDDKLTIIACPCGARWAISMRLGHPIMTEFDGDVDAALARLTRAYGAILSSELFPRHPERQNLNLNVEVQLSSRSGDPYDVGRDIGRGVSDELSASWRASGRVRRMSNIYREV